MSAIRTASYQSPLQTAPRSTTRSSNASLRRTRAQIAERFELTHYIRTISMGMMNSRAAEEA